MKISHLCLSCFYIDNYSYQENILPRQHKLDGNEVQIIASTETYTSNSKLGYVEPRRYINEDGITVNRIEYRNILTHFLRTKLRMHNGVFTLLEDFKPDVILFHGLCGWELLTVAKYKRLHPKVKFYADSHEGFHNSAQKFLSWLLLHKVYYRLILKSALPYIDKILCVSIDTMLFVESMYKIPKAFMEFFPLGGVIYDDEEYYNIRKRIRTMLKLSDRDILIIQAGKMGKRKKVLESLRAFCTKSGKDMHLLLIGSLDAEIRGKAEELIARNPNISFLGWKESGELMNYLCAADVYLQPGTQSALMQNAICQRCAVILDDVASHQPFVKGNGWLINEKLSLDSILEEINYDPEQLITMSGKSLSIAKQLLDYKKLAKRIYT